MVGAAGLAGSRRHGDHPQLLHGGLVERRLVPGLRPVARLPRSRPLPAQDGGAVFLRPGPKLGRSGDFRGRVRDRQGPLARASHPAAGRQPVRPVLDGRSRVREEPDPARFHRHSRRTRVVGAGPHQHPRTDQLGRRPGRRPHGGVYTVRETDPPGFSPPAPGTGASPGTSTTRSRSGTPAAGTRSGPMRPSPTRGPTTALPSGPPWRPCWTTAISWRPSGAPRCRSPRSALPV